MKKRNVALLATIMMVIPFYKVDAKTALQTIRELAETDTVNIATDDPDSNIRYIGLNPNNYVSFNNELWRIIGIFDGKIKIVRKDYLGSDYVWDSTDESINNGKGVNEWSTSKLMEELNGDYLNYNLTEDTLWYNGSKNKKEATFDHTKVLSADAQRYIANGVWNTGPDNSYNGTYYSNVKTVDAEFRYLSEKYSNDSKKCTSASCNDTVERHNSWTGKVGLITYADFVYSTSGGSTYDREYCLTHTWGWNTDCNKNSWMFTASRSNWSLSPIAYTGSNSYVISFTSYPNDGFAINTADVRPAVYLKTNTLITSGTGALDDPYILDLAKVVTFDTDGGSTIDDDIVEPGEKATKPTNPTKEDSTFLGWYSNKALTNKFNFDTEITDDTTLYAKWKFNYKILEGANQIFNNKDIVIKTNGDLTKLTGIKIDGKLVDSSNYTLKKGSTILTLSSKYLDTLNSDTHTISFIYDDGSVDTTLKVLANESKTEESKKDDTSKTSNPRTSDNIMTYITLLGISLIGFIQSKKKLFNK